MDESVYGVLGIKPSAKLARQEIAERCVLLMLNEAAMALDSGVVASARDGDIGAIFGIGFPPFLGGPFRYMDTLGIDHLVGRLEYYQKRHGDRFAPVPVSRRWRQSSRPSTDNRSRMTARQRGPHTMRASFYIVVCSGCTAWAALMLAEATD